MTGGYSRHSFPQFPKPRREPQLPGSLGRSLSRVVSPALFGEPSHPGCSPHPSARTGPARNSVGLVWQAWPVDVAGIRLSALNSLSWCAELNLAILYTAVVRQLDG